MTLKVAQCHWEMPRFNRSRLHSELRKKAIDGEVERCSRTRSFKVIDIGTGRNHIVRFPVSIQQ